MFAETFIYRHILNAEISQFCQRLGAVPPDPCIWDCLLGQIRTPLLKSLRTGLGIHLLLDFAENQIVFWYFKIQNSIQITEGSDNRDSDN